MDTTLVTVTVLSMSMAAALSVIVWRMAREERRRAEARAAALRDAAATESGGLPLRAEEPRVVATQPLFAPPAPATPWGNRLAVMAAIALLGTSFLLFALTASRTRTAAPAAGGMTAAAQPVEPGLELLSLRDARTPEALTITGLVRNPRSGSLKSRVAVVAYTFDDKGAFLASGRALLDVAALVPGDDSPFVVTVPVSDAVARYRIGFRSEDGRVIEHIDKRQAGPMAALGLAATGIDR